ncbi:MAG: hypothetical protein IJS01_10785 [Lentisphaeria bacterium]|nr:hypothetical protein [Lentisphaeria bacterium]
MDRIGKTVALALAVLCPLLAAAAPAGIQFGSIRIRVSFEQTPVPGRSGGSGGGFASGGVSFVNKRWLAVNVSFLPGVASKGTSGAKDPDNAKGIQGIPGRWLDDVIMHMYVAFPVERKRGTAVYGLFEGRTVFWSVRLDGRRHLAQMFIPPQLLDRYAAAAGPSGVRELALPLAEYRVMVEFTDSSGALLGRSFSSSGKTPLAPSFFKQIKEIPGAVVVPDSVLPRNKTPWGLHMPATFDYIRDDRTEDRK